MENETEECKHQPVCFCDEDEHAPLEQYEVEFWQNVRTSVQVWATSEDEAVHLVESWDVSKDEDGEYRVDWHNCFERCTDAHHPENARIIG